MNKSNSDTKGHHLSILASESAGLGLRLSVQINKAVIPATGSRIKDTARYKYDKKDVALASCLIGPA